MSVLDQLASALNRRDEEPNQHLAAAIAAAPELEGVREDIQELVDNLNNRDKNIRSDCIKVLYEIGAAKPEYIADYVDEFVMLLSSKDNRLVWGGMTALGAVAPLQPDAIWRHVNQIFDATSGGSVITQDWGIRTLAVVAAANERYAERIFPFLVAFLRDCRPKDVPRHAESILSAVTTPQKRDLLRGVLEAHKPALKPAQLKRVEKIIQQITT